MEKLFLYASNEKVIGRDDTANAAEPPAGCEPLTNYELRNFLKHLNILLKMSPPNLPSLNANNNLFHNKNHKYKKHFASLESH